MIPAHVSWLQNTKAGITTGCGRPIEVWALEPKEDNAALSAWAKHFRQHYVADDDLPGMVNGTGLSKADYLRTVLFPDGKVVPGPSLRSGDFGEILIADYIEFLFEFWTPRLRYMDRFNRHDSTKGCDVIGFKFAASEPGNPNDELFIVETKAGMAVSAASNRLQDAITDSAKDHLREAMTLNAMKQRLRVRGEQEGVDKIQRFQNEAALSFKRISGAAAILDDTVFAATNFGTVDASSHPNGAALRLIVIRGPSLMTLIHALYERAADEA